MRWRTPSTASWMPRWARPSRSSRSAKPELRSSSTLGCSSTPARTRRSTYGAVALFEHDGWRCPAPRAGGRGRAPPARRRRSPPRSRRRPRRHDGSVSAAATGHGGAGRRVGRGPDDGHDERRRRHQPHDEQHEQGRGEHGREPAAARRLARDELHGRAGAVERRRPGPGAVVVRAVGVLHRARQGSPQRDGEGGGRGDARGAELGGVRRATHSSQQVGVGEGVEPSGQRQLPAQRGGRAVPAVGDDALELHADERRAQAVEEVGRLRGRADRVGQHDLEPTGRRRRRPVDRPAGRLGVVEPQVAGEPGCLLDDLGIGDRRDRHGARPVGPDHDVDGGVDVARREQQHGDHAEQQAGGAVADHPDRMADRRPRTGGISGPGRRRPTRARVRRFGAGAVAPRGRPGRRRSMAAISHITRWSPAVIAVALILVVRAVVRPDARGQPGPGRHDAGAGRRHVHRHLRRGRAGRQRASA